MKKINHLTKQDFRIRAFIGIWGYDSTNEQRKWRNKNRWKKINEKNGIRDSTERQRKPSIFKWRKNCTTNEKNQPTNQNKISELDTH